MGNCETEISIKKGRHCHPSSTQFPLSWASTFLQVQRSSLEEGVIDFDLQKQKSFKPGQIYTPNSVG